MRRLLLVAVLSLVGCPNKDVSPSTSCDDAAKKAQKCGGIANLACPAGMRCVDDPCDDCDPAKGGRDCCGICVQTR